MPPELDNMDPGMGAEPIGQPAGEVDREGAMAKADLYKLANYSHKLFKQLNDDDQMEAWVQAKITKAADYIASVYHYLEYEMKFSEYGHHLDNSDTLNEGQKMRLKEVLAEAKDKMKDLKKSQAEKMKAKKEAKVDEGVLSGGHKPCVECGGTGMVYEEPKPIPAHVQGKVEKYKRLTKATHAAHKRLDANNNGIPDDEEMEEGFDAGEKVGSTKKTRTGVMTKTSTGVTHKNTSHSDEEHGEPVSKVKSRSAADKAGDKAADKAQEKDYKAAKKANPEGVRRYSLGKQVDEAAKPDFLDMDKDGNKKESMKKAVADKKKDKKVEEAAPSAGLSKAKKSAVVKDAKAGKDLGKPGKSFDKVAKAAGGGEKGKKIAAAAMWKNVKEATAYMMEKEEASKKADKDYDGDGKVESGKDEHAGSVDKAIKAAKAKETVKESTEFTLLQSQLARLNRSETTQINESSEADKIRALTKRLLG